VAHIDVLMVVGSTLNQLSDQFTAATNTFLRSMKELYDGFHDLRLFSNSSYCFLDFTFSQNEKNPYN